MTVVGPLDDAGWERQGIYPERTGPGCNGASVGYDLALTELLDERGHRFLVDVRSQQGADILETAVQERVAAAAGPVPPMRPVRYVVAARREETYDTVTLLLRPVGRPIPAPRPGQFTMLYTYGVGEVPVSVSGFGGSAGRRDHVLVQTIRAVGAVTRALCAAAPGDVVGVRGPFGTDWQVNGADGRDMLVVAGGIGLAPLRPVLLTALAQRARYDRVVLLVGARSPGDLIFTRELETWRRRGADVRVTVDHSHIGWNGHVGLVTR